MSKTKVEKFVYHTMNKHNYPRFVLCHMLLDEGLRKDFAPHIAEYELWCTYQGARHRVTGVKGNALLLHDLEAHFDDVSDWGPDAMTVLPVKEDIDL